MRIDGFTVKVSPEIALEDIKFEISVLQKGITWTQKSILNAEQESLIVVSFTSSEWELPSMKHNYVIS